MRKIKLLHILLFLVATVSCPAQEKDLSKAEAKQEEHDNGLKINKDAIKFGVSLGFNYLTKDIYDASLSPINNTLQLEKASPASFLLSTAVVINPISGYYRKLDSAGNPVGDIYTRTWPISFIATVNLAQFGSAQTSFNKKIDGGLGLGYRLSDDFHIALTAEMISVRQLRDYIADSYKGTTITVNNEVLNALDTSDNRFFTDKYMFGVSLKFVYILID